MMQLMQIIGERNVRIVPGVAVNGAGANGGLVEGLLGMLMKEKLAKAAWTKGERPRLRPLPEWRNLNT